MGKPGDERSELNLEGGLGVLPWKKLIQGSSNWLKITLMFVPQY